MRSVIVVALLAIGVTACSDPVTAPRPGSDMKVAYFKGDPPPPPLTGVGDATLSSVSTGLTSGFAATVAQKSSHTASCDVPTFTFQFDWKYFVNRPENNAWIHLDEQSFNGHSEFHSTNKKNDANGQIVGPGFTFQLSDLLDGSVFNESRQPGTYFFTVSGKLTLADGTKCDATANLFLNLDNSETE